MKNLTRPSAGQSAPDGFTPIEPRKVHLLGTEKMNVANEGTATAINQALHRVWITDVNGKTFDFPMGNVQGLEPLALAHTPGPWKLHGSLPFVIDPRNLEVIANCDSARARPFDIDRENARLISAAPDLLRELKAAAEYLAKLRGDFVGYQYAAFTHELYGMENNYRAAIAKASEEA